MISRQSHTFSGIIVLVTAKIALGFVYYSYNYSLIALKYVRLPIQISLSNEWQSLRSVESKLDPKYVNFPFFRSKMLN